MRVKVQITLESGEGESETVEGDRAKPEATGSGDSNRGQIDLEQLSGWPFCGIRSQRRSVDFQGHF